MEKTKEVMWHITSATGVEVVSNVFKTFNDAMDFKTDLQIRMNDNSLILRRY